MKKEQFKIGNIPAILWGEDSGKLYLFFHGQGGSKEEAETFSAIVCPDGWQVLSIDFPEHGERKRETNAFDPWHIVPELCEILQYAKLKWGRIAIFANSIGAWFSMQSFEEETLEHCLFVSPILDMNQLIQDMMQWANVTEAQLEREQIIPTTFGQTLSWEYLTYVRDHPITNWKIPTSILYAGNDNLTQRFTADTFVTRFGCDLTVMEQGDHWFHTPQQLQVLEHWIEDKRIK